MSKGSLIGGGVSWMCMDPETKRYSPILREIINQPSIDYNLMTIQFETKIANYGQFFQNLDFSFKTNAKMHHKTR